MESGIRNGALALALLLAGCSGEPSQRSENPAGTMDHSGGESDTGVDPAASEEGNQDADGGEGESSDTDPGGSSEDEAGTDDGTGGETDDGTGSGTGDDTGDGTGAGDGTSDGADPLGEERSLERGKIRCRSSPGANDPLCALEENLERKTLV